MDCGKEVICKKTCHYGIFKPGKSYKILKGEYDTAMKGIVIVSKDGSMYFFSNYDDSCLLFGEYFYTDEEIRKLKLEKLK